MIYQEGPPRHLRWWAGSATMGSTTLRSSPPTYAGLVEDDRRDPKDLRERTLVRRTGDFLKDLRFWSWQELINALKNYIIQ